MFRELCGVQGRRRNPPPPPPPPSRNRPAVSPSSPQDTRPSAAKPAKPTILTRLVVKKPTDIPRRQKSYNWVYEVVILQIVPDHVS